MSVAQLGLAVDSKDAKQAAVDLDALTDAAAKAEKGTSSLGRTSRENSATLQAMASAIQNIERHTAVMAAGMGNASAAINATATAAAGLATGQRTAATATTTATAALSAQSPAAKSAAAAITQVNTAVAQSAAATPTATAQMHRYTQAMNDNAKASRELSFQRRNLSFQLLDISQSLALGMPPLMIALQQGPQIAQIWGAGEGGIGRAFAETAGMIGRFTVAALPLIGIVGAVSLAFAGLTRDINQAGKVQVSFWDTLVATAEVSSEAVLRALDPVWTGIQNGFGRVWDFIQPTLKLIGNTMIASFVGAFEHIKFLFGNNGEGLGSIIAAGVIGGVNLVIQAINALVDKVRAGLNEIVKIANSLGANISELKPGATIKTLDNPAFRNAQRLTSERDRNISDAFGTDYLGDAYDSISKRAREVSERPSEEEQKRLDRLAKQQAEALERRIEQHKQALMTEEELENESYAKRMEDLTAYYEAGKLSLEEYQDWSQRAQEKHSERLTEIAQEQTRKEMEIRSQLLGSLGSLFGSLAQLAEASGSKGLAAAKAFGVAEAVVNTAQGITKALTLPFPLNWAQAAAVGAAGAAQIATILSAKPGGAKQPTVSGGSGASATGSSSGSTATPQPDRTAYVNITGAPGSTYTREQLIEMMENFVELQRDGYKLVLSGQ